VGGPELGLGLRETCVLCDVGDLDCLFETDRWRWWAPSEVVAWV